jgi:GntR family transcriptional repressor for pyruvate dehydrogenase complex
MARRAKSKLLTVSGLGPVKKESVGQQVVGQIVELIRTGNLRRGDRLPSERELVEIFGISRPSLRESMRALSVLGIIESRHGGGAFVTELDATAMLAPLDLFLALSKANFDDAFESRRIIEIEIVRKAAMKATRADIQDLNDMIAAHPKIQNDLSAFASWTAASMRAVGHRRQRRPPARRLWPFITWASISAAAPPRSLA